MAASPLVRPLLENFRMNDVLTSCAARLLYGPGYQCVDPAVARRRLPFKPGRKTDALVKACLDPEYPLVVVVLEGIRSARANPVEADLTAQLVAALREGLRGADGRVYASDADFFRQGVFVVSPHHAQIQAIQQELHRRRQWQAPPFVDTVDKMQGQEADVVVVSYGVADPELALQEAEFIYGLNRLNVAITRARCKTIVCLPGPLLEASPQVLDRDQAAVGLGFMRRLVETIRQHGDEQYFEGEEVEAHLLRLGTVV
jgi:superfamily I DNA and/or RNA helicase